MVLESLLELVETLRARIDEHGVALRQSEALTRAALIDPLLRELGWNTEDPALVMPEYRLGRGYADYALLSNGKPMVMVEAKKLGTPLQDAASQGIGYCIEAGIAYFAVTDGRLWEIYETHKMAPISEKLAVQFDIAHSLPNTCLKAMALWRPAVEHGSVMAAGTPIVGLDVMQQVVAAAVIEDTVASPTQTVTDVSTIETQIQQPQTVKTQSTPPSTNELVEAWIPLSEFRPHPKDPVPSEIRFPDGTGTQIQNWYMLVTETVRWLYENGHLNQTNLRVQTASNFVVSDSPRHPNGKPFKNGRIIKKLHINTGSDRYECVRNTRALIRHVGLQLSQFRVRTIEYDRIPHGYISLSELYVAQGVKPPSEILFPDNLRIPIVHWNAIPTEITRWLLKNNILKESHCPILFGSRYIVSSSPVHPSGKRFSRPKQVETLYVETNLRNMSNEIVVCTNLIIKHTGQDPEKFKVWFA